MSGAAAGASVKFCFEIPNLTGCVVVHFYLFLLFLLRLSCAELSASRYSRAGLLGSPLATQTTGSDDPIDAV